VQVYLDTFRQAFAATSRITPEEILPCTEEEVRTLEHRLGSQLPAAYRAWLLWMGHGAGPFLRGTSVFYDALAGLKDGALELLHEHSLEGALPADALVFYLHQGYVVQFLRVSEGDNPPVYGYAEGSTPITPTRWYDTLETWLAAELEGYLQVVQHH
jgi:hypothetical protein